MVKGLSQLFAAGPPVVKQATFEDLSKEELGGWEIHATNGTVDNVATSELDAFHHIRAFLSYLPPSIFQHPPSISSTDPSDRREDELIRIIPRRRARPYDIRKLIALIVDMDGNPYPDSSSSFFEIGSSWGRCIVTGFARLAGRPVGVLSSDCIVNGGIATIRSYCGFRYLHEYRCYRCFRQSENNQVCHALQPLRVCMCSFTVNCTNSEGRYAIKVFPFLTWSINLALQ